MQRCGAVVTELDASGVDVSVVHPDRLIAAVADRQSAVVTRQLLHRGAYLWGCPSPTSFARALAAVYACRDGALLSHHAATALWEIRPAADEPTDVTVIGRRVRHDGIRLAHDPIAGRATPRGDSCAPPGSRLRPSTTSLKASMSTPSGASSASSWSSTATPFMPACGLRTQPPPRRDPHPRRVPRPAHDVGRADDATARARRAHRRGARGRPSRQPRGSSAPRSPSGSPGRDRRGSSMPRR